MEVGETGVLGLPVVKYAEMGQQPEHGRVTTLSQKMAGQIVWGQQLSHKNALVNIVQVSNKHFKRFLHPIIKLLTEHLKVLLHR